MRKAFAAAAALLAVAVTAAGCTGAEGAGGGPRIAVTTPILGDVVTALVDDRAEVEVIMPRGASPHDFQPSARQVVAMADADALIVNGFGFEAGLEDALEAAADDGADVYEVAPTVEPLAANRRDPHFFNDPARMLEAVRGIARHLRATVPALATASFGASVRAYERRLRATDAAVERILAPIPPDRRKLVTDHDVFGHFADRYRFRVVGALIPSLSAQAEASARHLTELAATIRAEQVPAIFADTNAPSRLADRLAATTGVSVAVVVLFGESLGPEGSAGGSYLAMMATNASRIAAALE